MSMDICYLNNNHCDLWKTTTISGRFYYLSASSSFTWIYFPSIVGRQRRGSGTLHSRTRRNSLLRSKIRISLLRSGIRSSSLLHTKRNGFVTPLENDKVCLLLYKSMISLLMLQTNFQN